MGDPGGIGPEVLVKALADPALRRQAHFRIYGVAGPMERAAEAAGIAPYWWRLERGSALAETTLGHDVVLMDSGQHADLEPRPTPNRTAGALSFGFVEEAIRDAQRKDSDPLRAGGVVTGPISKEAWSLAGRGKYPGHTELFATRFGARRHAMFFESPKLRVVLATAHIALMDIRNALTIGRVFDAIDLGAEATGRILGRPARVAVCGLNPHAGEHGLMGDEEERLIEPAIRAAREAGLNVDGPFPPDAIFMRALAGEFDLVVAMYHDQGLIPLKLLARDEAVNATIGLPIVRTSPDHGTAFDIAGRNRAEAGSMTAAINLAIRMLQRPAADRPRAHVSGQG